jgi:hypothetical protein
MPGRLKLKQQGERENEEDNYTLFTGSIIRQ